MWSSLHAHLRPRVLNTELGAENLRDQAEYKCSANSVYHQCSRMQRRSRTLRVSVIREIAGEWQPPNSRADCVGSARWVIDSSCSPRYLRLSAGGGMEGPR